MSGARVVAALAVVMAVLTAALRAGDAQAPAPPRVDGAVALRHVERLVAIGPRVAGSRHARHLIHHAQWLLDVQDHGDGEHRVEAPIGERQPMPVGATKHEAATRCAA